SKSSDKQDETKEKSNEPAPEVTIRSRDGERQATFPGRDKFVTIRNGEGKVLHVFEGHPADNLGVINVAFSPNGRFVLFHTRNDAIKVWDLNTGKVARSCNPRTSRLGPGYPVVSPDGRFLCLHDDEGVTVVDFDDLTDRVSPGKVGGIWFSSDGR